MTRRLLLATDVFPPRCGGSGWSTYYLARALRARGHHVTIARAVLDPRRALPYEYDGFRVEPIAVPTPPLPLARNLAKNELFWAIGERGLATLARRHQVELIHGQHVMTIPAAVRAGRRLGLPVVATVRDYWATCPISTRLRPDGICTQCTPGRLTECLANHQPLRFPVVRVLQGYVEANRRRRQAALAAADQVIAVSRYVAHDLALHAGIEATVLPNLIDLPIDPPAPPDAWPTIARPSPATTSADSSSGITAQSPPGYVVFVGKLDRHKGADQLPAILQATQRPLTLVVLGDGPLSGQLTADCHRLGVPLYLTSVPNAAVLRWLAHARAVLAPARWPEPLSRVLLEAVSVGCPIIATPTGGTPDIVDDGRSGFLAATSSDFVSPLRRLVDDPVFYHQTRAAARALAKERFATPSVLARLELLYDRLVTHP